MKIALNKTIGIDLSTLIETRLAILANSGGGKSYTIRRVIEQAFGKVQIIVIDPEGEYGNLREKYDFILAGKDADAAVETRTAALLAIKLLETQASAIIDLYDLSPQDRKKYVRLFLESVMNAPKELYHDVIFVLDEAHVFAPEKEQSEALSSVIALASQGRKRGFCPVIATQRISKMSKDVLAECNNKMIGRMTLDVDRKRAGEELGLSNKDDIRALRNLKPGEFYVFGPAISDDVLQIQIGDVHVKPPKRGSARSLKTPPPSSKVKAILAKLADLPQEAQKQATTVAELKSENAALKGENTRLKASSDNAVPSKEIQQKWYDLGVNAAETTWRKENENVRKDAQAQLKKYEGVFNKIADTIRPVITDGIVLDLKKRIVIPELPREKQQTYDEPYRPSPELHARVAEVRSNFEKAAIAKGEAIVLAAIAQHAEGMTREHITVQTGYKRSTRDAYIQRLVQKELIYLGGSGDGRIYASQSGKNALGSDFTPLPTGRDLIEHHIRTLPQGESAILQLLSNVIGNYAISRDEITEKTGYQRSTRDAYLQRLAARQLVEFPSAGMVRMSEYLA